MDEKKPAEEKKAEAKAPAPGEEKKPPAEEKKAEAKAEEKKADKPAAESAPKGA